MHALKTLQSSVRGKLKQLKYPLVLAIVGLTLAGTTGYADEANEVSKLIQRNQFDQAQARADAYLANRPNDAQMRFLKGLILTERNKTNEAINVFTKLTEDFPELPEPYNNLAVLYAGKGEYEKARESLEMAIRTHPSYATAHENLGDVYAKLASQSYDKALQLDGRNSTAQTKLSLVRNLIAGKPDAVAVAAVAPAASPKAPSKPAAEAKAPAVVPPAPASTAPAAVATAPSKAASEPKPAAGNAESQVLAAVEAWAKAWTDQDIGGYLGAYSEEFETPGKMNRASWEKMREQRIVGKENIRVVVESPQITVNGNEAVVKFKQSYFSNRLNNVSGKTLTMKQEGGAWKITSEKVGG